MLAIAIINRYNIDVILYNTCVRKMRINRTVKHIINQLNQILSLDKINQLIFNDEIQRINLEFEEGEEVYALCINPEQPNSIILFKQLLNSIPNSKSCWALLSNIDDEIHLVREDSDSVIDRFYDQDYTQTNYDFMYTVVVPNDIVVPCPL